MLREVTHLPMADGRRGHPGLDMAQSQKSVLMSSFCGHCRLAEICVTNYREALPGGGGRGVG